MAQTADKGKPGRTAEGNQTTAQEASVSRETAASGRRGADAGGDEEGLHDIPTNVARDAQGTVKYERDEDANAAALLRERQQADAAGDSDRVSEIENEIRKAGYRVPTEGETERRTAEQDSPAQRTATV